MMMTEETVETSSESAKPTLNDLNKVSKMKHKALSQLTSVHLNVLLGRVLDTRASYNNKVQAANALVEAVLFALDFGVSVTNAKIRSGGPFAKEVNNLAGVLAQANDIRMVLMAGSMAEEQEKEVVEQTTETQGEENV
jgi:hypothetical protein